MKYALFFLVFPFILPFCGCGRAAVPPPPRLPAIAASFAPAPVQAPASPSTAKQTFTIALQPLGKVPADRIAMAKATIAATYNATVTILPGVSLPEATYYPPRGRYRAERLLDFLTKTTPAAYDKVIGLTESDISTTKGEYPDWGIFGLGNLSGRACVVSDYRLRNVPATRFRSRYANLVIHEVGHTLGRDHCPTAGCVMQDAKGTVRAVDSETGAFCPACRAQLAPYLRER